jgi:hypothetical protein
MKNVYRLENKEQDVEFLSGKEVHCRAVLEQDKERIESGDFILVLLSNGKKYKGKVRQCRFFPVDRIIAGEITIVRA